MPDLDLGAATGPLQVFALLHAARPTLLNLGASGDVDIMPWADRGRRFKCRERSPDEKWKIG